jgi:uncharacterized protein YciI
MKPAILLLCLLFTGITLTAQTENKDYDPALAKMLGADDYGMKSYVLVILKTGSYEEQDPERRDSLFRGHMNNINRLAEMGKLVVAGPLGENDASYRGIFILDVRSMDEARELLITDPTIEAKVFETELFPWYGSAALPEYLKVHARIEKIHH